MHKLSLPPVLGADPEGMPVFGVNAQHFFIYEPTLSTCGRFEADPLKEYGLNEQDVKTLAMLNERLKAAVEDALNAGCKTIQDALGVTSGDEAGLFFSGDERTKPLLWLLARYMEVELLKVQAQAS